MEIRTHSELGRTLLTERGMQWLYAHGGDPYARLLRAEEKDDRRDLAERIRELGPLYRSSTGAWVTGSRTLGAEILGDPRLGPRGPEAGLGSVWRQGPSGLGLPRAGLDGVAELAVPHPRADDVERLCAAKSGRAGSAFDLVCDVVRPVLVALLGDLLAVPREKREPFERWCGSAAPALDAEWCPPTLPRAVALHSALDGLRSLLAETAGPVDATVAAGLSASVVGVEVTTNLVANAVLALLDQPEQWRLLCVDPGAAEAAVEETLRYDPPVRVDSRVAREDLDLAGRAIAGGDEVVVHIEAANREAGPLRDPGRFDLRRETTGGHLSLVGTRLGAVAPAARTSAAAILRALAARVPGLRRTGPVVRRLRAPVTHAVVRFPVGV
ncbi:P450-derived glycosyltransferase activator [Streptomyces sp. NPDC006332]|uniref:cytochrome P450 family protein n=1 Tax=Streptomyces sp. NPDC006332 TaxID=3155456 RepID=UPI0033B9BFD1